MVISVGKIAYFLYHQPLTWWLDRRDAMAGRRGETEMRTAVMSLKPLALARWGLEAPPVRFLTGARFVHQTLFCAQSFAWACGSHFRLEVYDDGTLTPENISALQTALPGAIIPAADEVTARLDAVLPVDRYPHLRRMRETHPLMRKLLDLHAGKSGPSLYLDSDMLFFARPPLLCDWMRKPEGEFHMRQSGDALVANRAELAARFGLTLAEGVNSGILALDDDGFDWPLLERAAAAMTVDERAHKWAEQTLFAVRVSHRHSQSLPSSDYQLCHGREDFGGATPPLRHYLHKSKSIYTAREWRLWQNRAAAAPTSRPA
ncbi:MAG: hypothetical protein IT582_00620 [Opitutaceae bacterium]|nr:hypothetical protein [Opitutaceae bacterium]